MTTDTKTSPAQRLSALGHPGYSDAFATRVLVLLDKVGCSPIFAVSACLQTDHQLRWLNR